MLIVPELYDFSFFISHSSTIESQCYRFASIRLAFYGIEEKLLLFSLVISNLTIGIEYKAVQWAHVIQSVHNINNYIINKSNNLQVERVFEWLSYAFLTGTTSLFIYHSSQT